jgi:hypothetical protein
MEPSGRNQWQPVAKIGSNKPKPLLPVETSCRSERMVRRGSTVRVLQRALQKSRKSGLLRSDRLALRRMCCGMEPLWSFSFSLATQFVLQIGLL